MSIAPILSFLSVRLGRGPAASRHEFRSGEGLTDANRGAASRELPTARDDIRTMVRYVGVEVCPFGGMNPRELESGVAMVDVGQRGVADSELSERLADAEERIEELDRAFVRLHMAMKILLFAFAAVILAGVLVVASV